MRALLAVALAATLSAAQAAPPSKVEWSVAAVQSDSRAGEAVTLAVTAKTAPGWHIYDLKKTGDWVQTVITLAEGGSLRQTGDTTQPEPQTKFDNGFQTETAFFEGGATFGVPASIDPAAKDKAEGKVKVTFQACDATSCLDPTTIELPATVQLTPGATRSDHLSVTAEALPQPADYVRPSPAKPFPIAKTTAPVDEQAAQIDAAKKQGILPFLLLSFGAGLLALLTPCVWPMVPVTVSFFTKRSSEAGGKNLKGALWYCAGIMGTFVALGLVTSALFGAANIQVFAANPWVNLGLGLLFVVLAANLFGAFELTVPQSWVGKAQGGTKSGGIVGPLLMGLVFSMTSFTCTVPFVGTLLVTASQGDWVYPLLGMLAFSSAFALPFFFLALFPSAISKLPKSGAWLVDVKAYMGLLEVAAALKFFSNFDATLNATPIGWLPKEVFLAVWATLFGIGTLFLLGWIRFPHSDLTKPGPVRLGLAAVNLFVTVFLLGALAGKTSLGQWVGFLPPYSVGKSNGVLAYHETLEAATKEATDTKKLVFANFTGVTCTNCRVMEQEVFPQHAVKDELARFARAELYTDRANPGDRANAQLREALTKSVTNPVYVVMKADRTVVAVHQGAASPEVFAKFLRDARENAR